MYMYIIKFFMLHVTTPKSLRFSVTFL